MNATAPTTPWSTLARAAALAAALLLQACGGGGGGGTDPSANAAPAADVVPTDVALADGEMTPVYVIGSVQAESTATLETPLAVTGAAPRYMTPALMQAAYGLNSVYSAANPATQGAGQTVAVIAAYHNPGIAADLANFSTKFGLPACGTGCFSVVYTVNGVPTTKAPAVNTGWAVESSLDVEWVHAVAPQAKIVLVEAASASYNDLLAAAYYAANTLKASVVNMSFGGPEWSGEVAASQSYFGNTKASFVAASGDSGYGASYPAASSNVLTVGGTTLSTTSTGIYGAETAWKGSGGGLSAYETVLPTAYPVTTSASLVNAWTTAKKRPIPDVSYDADPASGFYVVSQTGIGAGYYGIVGGTSAGAPQWSGLIAIANALRAKAGKAAFTTAQMATGTKVTIQSALENLSAGKVANAPAYAELFNDVNTLTNGTCGLYCTASGGWDLVTGMGTPKAAKLVPALAAF